MEVRPLEIQGPDKYQLGDVLLYPQNFPKWYLVIKFFNKYAFLNIQTNEVEVSRDTLAELYEWGHDDEIKVDAHIEIR